MGPVSGLVAGETPAFCPPAIVVHSFAQACAALTAAAEAGRAIMLLSAPEAGLIAGPGWWRALVGAARAAVPGAEFTAVLDCGEDAGAAQGAIRAGAETIVYTGRGDIAVRLAQIAAPRGAALLTERPAAVLDLATMLFANAKSMSRRCAAVLASAK